MPAFLVDPAGVDGDRLVMEDEEAHHVRVRRYAVGDEVDVIDGVGCAYRARLLSVTPRRVEAEIIARHPGHGESPVALHLAAAMPKGARFDLVVEKATEVGVASITPVLMERGVARPGAEGGRRERWLRLARAAAKQCGRSRVPEVVAPVELGRAVAVLAASCDALLLAGPGGTQDLVAAFAGVPFPLRNVALFVGPEGGFEPAEWQDLRARGARAFTWGPRILRAETAAVVLSALVLDAAERGASPRSA